MLVGLRQGNDVRSGGENGRTGLVVGVHGGGSEGVKEGRKEGREELKEVKERK
jgi:hypothetical protein